MSGITSPQKFSRLGNVGSIGAKKGWMRPNHITSPSQIHVVRSSIRKAYRGFPFPSILVSLIVVIYSP